MYSMADMDWFDADFKKQLDFNFATTRNTQKQREAHEGTRMSRLRDIDLDLISQEPSTIITNQSELSRYILEDHSTAL